MIDIRLSLRPMIRLAALLAAGVALASCTPVGAALGVGATAGVYSQQDRGLNAAANDSKIALDIFDKWFKWDHTMPVALSKEVHNGRVLITGIVDKPEQRDKAGELVWQIENVKEVINEIQVGIDHNVVDSAKDSWISTQLETQILFDRDIRNINYMIDTVNGTVYLFGMGRSQTEVDIVANHARNIEGVTKVVSHVELLPNAQSAERLAQ
ncbi:MAG: BON domain-containing protein [Rhodospirillales bacterium]